MSVSTLARPVRPRLSKDIAPAERSSRSAPKTVRYSFLLFVFSFPFEPVQLPYITAPGMFSLTNLTGLAFFAFYLFHLGIPFKKTVPEIPAAVGWFLGYVLSYALGGLSGSGSSDTPGGDYFLRFTTVIQLVVFLWCAADLLKQEKLAKGVLVAFSSAGVILAIGALLHLPGFVPAIRTRTRALGMNPNRVAALMVYTAMILIGLCLNGQSWSRKLRCGVLLLALPVIALMVSTGSRAGIGALVIGISMFFFARGGLKRKTIAGLISLLGVTVVLVVAAGDPLASRRWERFFEEGHTAGRDLIFGAGLEMIHERPLFGWGRSAFDELGLRSGRRGHVDAHNFLLYLLLEVGVVGTVPFLIGIFLCVRAAWKARTGSLGILPLALLMSSLAMMMTHTGLRFKPFWLFLALALASLATRQARNMVPVYGVANSHFRFKHQQPASRHLSA